MSILGDNIRKLREERRWTQAKLSEESGIALHYIGALERGVRSAGPKTRARLCDAFMIEERDLWGTSGDKDLQELQSEIERVFSELGANDLASKHHFLAEMHRKIKALVKEGQEG